MKIYHLIMVIFSLVSPTHSLLNQTISMIYQNYQGTWQILSSTTNPTHLPSPFNQFTLKQGQTLVQFKNYGKKRKLVQGLTLRFFMPKYYDQNNIKLSIDFGNNFREKLNRWEGNTSANYQIFVHSIKQQSGQIQLQYIADDNIIEITINQTFSIIISFNPKYLSSSTSFFFAIIAFVVFFIIRRKNKVQQTNIRHQNITLIISIVLIFLISICQLLMGLKSLFGTMSPQAFLTVAGIINIVTCYQICRFYGHFIIEQKVRMIALFILFCFYIWFLLYFRHNWICLTINSLLFIPEIAYHSWKGQKIEGDFRFIFFNLSCQTYILYFKSTPLNMFRQSPNYLLGFIICILLLLQTILLMGQIFIGPRFFIPSLCRPNYYNYYDQTNVKQASKLGNQCYICLEQMKIRQSNYPTNLLQLLQKNKKIMVTPCQHIFHTICLQKWMIIQMKCPIDRSNLPPL